MSGSSFLDVCRFNPTAGGTTDWTYSTAVTGYQGPAAAGAVNGAQYSYRAEIADLSQWEEGQGIYNSSTGVLTRATVLYNSAGTGSGPGQSGAGTKINFGAVPQVAVIALAEDLLSAGGANGFTAAQQSQLRSNLGMSTEIGKIEQWPTSALQAGRLACDGSSYLRATYPLLYGYLVKSGNCTFTNGSSTVNMPGHGLSKFDPVKLFTTAALPTNFTAGTHGLPTVGTNYFVASVVDANNVTLSATAGGAAITAGSAGSGVQSWVSAPYGDGDGATTFTVPDFRGYFLRGWDSSGAVDPGRSLGSVQVDAFQGHRHAITDATGFSWVYERGSNGIWTSPTGGAAGDLDRQGLSLTCANAPIADTSNGAPRTAAETRPKNYAAFYTIRYSA